MTTIDEIMAQARHLARVTSAANRSGKWPSPEKTASRDGAENALRALITQAIAEARADGAREMREAAAKAAASVGLDQHTQWNGMPVCFALDVGSACAEAIRALPLPTGEREPVRLSVHEMDRIAGPAAAVYMHRLVDVETAVLAANGLTT